MNPHPEGFRIARQLLSADDVAALREAITETIDRVAGALRTPFAASRPDAPLEDRLEQVARHDAAYAFALHHAVMADTQHDPRLQALALHPGLRAAVAETVAPLVPTGHVIRTRAVIPAFQSARAHWHQDVVRPSDDGSRCGSVRVACWIPLSDVDAGSGALEVLPGAWAGPLPHEASGDGRFGIAEADLPDVTPEVIPLRCGDVLMLDRFVPHRALPVHHGRARWAVVVWVKAAGRERPGC